MKITRYAMMLAAATGLLSACQKLDEVKAYDPDKVVAPVLHALPGEIVITPDNMGSTQTFTWDRLRRPHPDQLLDRSLVQRRCETGALHGNERHLVGTDL